MSVWLLLNAYDAGTLAATQPGITLIDPVTSTALGCWLRRQRQSWLDPGRS
jgi:hypothetical protein